MRKRQVIGQGVEAPVRRLLIVPSPIFQQRERYRIPPALIGDGGVAALIHCPDIFFRDLPLLFEVLHQLLISGQEKAGFEDAAGKESIPPGESSSNAVTEALVAA